MSDLPFTISPEAAARIERDLAHLEQEPDCQGLLPCLRLSLGQRHWDANGQLTESFRGESWDVGNHDPEDIVTYGFVSLSLCGRTVWFLPDDLDELRGKRLVIETVGVGVPSAADKKAELLRAV